MTRGAEAALPRQEILVALGRHLAGDWGNACSEDVAQNEWALLNQARLISNFEASDGTAFWIITEADRSSTTVLLPEEY